MAKKQLFKPSKIKESLVISDDQIEEYEERGYSIKLIKGQLRAYKELEKWEEFETEIRKFLAILGFENVNKAPINLGGHNVDVVGSCDGAFLIIEAKTRREIRGNVKQELEKFNGWKDDIAKTINKKYPDYSNIKFIFCTDFIIEDNSKKFAKNNKIFLWDYNYIKEYESLYSILGDSTKYHILYELGCKPKLTGEFLVPAFRIRQRNRTIYNFFIEPEMLLKIAYVFRRISTQREKAYQRPLKPGRLERIRKFLEEENGTFINNIVINFKENLYFRPIKIESFDEKTKLPNWLETGLLKMPNSYCCAEIIDGQHRTYGFTKTVQAKKEVKLPVVALDNASEIERATFFIKINKEQKPVDANLLWDLAGEIEPNTDAGLISNTVKCLNKYTPFKDMISIPSETVQNIQRPILLANFCNGIENRDFVGILKSEKNLFKVLREYFLQLSSLFSYDWRFGKKGFMCANPGVNVMLRILKRILIHKKGKIPSKNEINKLLKPVSKYFRKKYYKKDKPNERKMSELRKRCASEAGRGDVEKEFLEQLAKTNQSYKLEG